MVNTARKLLQHKINVDRYTDEVHAPDNKSVFLSTQKRRKRKKSTSTSPEARNLITDSYICEHTQARGACVMCLSLAQCSVMIL